MVDVGELMEVGWRSWMKRGREFWAAKRQASPKSTENRKDGTLSLPFK